MVTILQAATESRITKQKVRYWVDLLEIPITKKERKFYLPDNAISLLIAMRESINSGLAPALAAKEVLSTYAAPEQSKAVSLPVKEDKRLDSLERAVMLLVESNKKLSEDNKRLHTQNNMILEQVKLIRMSNKPLKHKTFQVWQPPVKQAAKVSLIKRLWLEIFNPEALRATP